MITANDLKKMPPHTVFSRGVYEMEDGVEIRWVAKRGEISDWAVYYAPVSWEWNIVRKHGDKAHPEFAQELVGASVTAMRRYRK